MVLGLAFIFLKNTYEVHFFSWLSGSGSGSGSGTTESVGSSSAGAVGAVDGCGCGADGAFAFVEVHVSAPSTVAQSLADAMVNAGLVACVQVSEVFVWVLDHIVVWRTEDQCMTCSPTA